MFINKIYIIDFEDSFTNNIASEIYLKFNNVEVVDHEKFFNEFTSKIVDINIPIGIILGPGPGHPDKFKHYLKPIQKLLINKNIFILGICLGHQILGQIFGLVINPAKRPVHGETENIVYKNQVIEVQRYNSLVPESAGLDIESLVIDNEVYILKGSNFISYQFHPESVGTSDREIFFKPILDHICTGKKILS